jgi:hypothetical protein
MSGGSASTSIVSRPHRAFTCVTACIFAGPRGPFHQRLRRIRYLLRRFDCYWASNPSQAGLPPAKMHTHSRRTDITLYTKTEQKGGGGQLNAQKEKGKYHLQVTASRPRRTAKSKQKGTGPCFRPAVPGVSDLLKPKNGPVPGLCSSPASRPEKARSTAMVALTQKEH